MDHVIKSKPGLSFLITKVKPGEINRDISLYPKAM